SRLRPALRDGRRVRSRVLLRLPRRRRARLRAGGALRVRRPAWIGASSVALVALAALGALASLGPPARAQQECGCPGFEAAPPPPHTPGWEHVEANVTASLNDTLFLRADVIAMVTDADGEPSWQGGHLRVENRGRCPF